jgi:hypothetical protein
LAKQTSRGLTLSLLLDLCLLLHPRQIARVESKLPAYTVGILLRNIQMEAFLLYFEQLLQAPNPVEELIKLSQSVQVKSVSARVFPSLIVWKTYER